MRCDGIRENSIGLYKSDNGGFSLVEVIVCVTILLIAAAPLLKSLSMTSKVNGKAQRMQNATSIAESIMEEVKGKSLDDLASELNGSDASGKPIVINFGTSETDFSATATTAGQRASWAKSSSDTDGSFLTGGTAQDPYYVVYYPEQQSNSGEKYNVTVYMSADKYKQGTDTLTTVDDTTDDNVIGANKVRLPQIDEIDTLSQMVLSIQDFQRYDVAALDYFNQRKADFDPDPTKSSTHASIQSKTINIVKKDVTGSTDTIRVDCTITYLDGDGNSFTRSLYTGTYTQQLKDGSTTEYEDLNSNVFLFYRKSSGIPNEVINVTDTSTVGSHRVYFVMQDDDTGHRITDIAGTTIKIANSTDSIIMNESNYSLLDGNGNIAKGDLKLITNLGKNASEEGRIYEKNAKLRILDVIVEVTKDSESDAYVTLESTKKVYILTPTPTPP